MNNMSFVFRVDASTCIGAGHVMRCLAVAEQLKEQVKSTVFICRKSDADLISYIQEQGHEVVALSALKEKESEGDLSNITVESLVQLTLKKHDPCCCIVDHYEIDWRWESVIKPFCKLLCVIDDLANRRHVCDILLDSEFGEKFTKYKALVPPDCKLLLGPSFALLRKQFQKKNQSNRNKTSAIKPVKVILVNVGAFDQKNIIPRIIKAIFFVCPTVEIRIIIGSKTPNFEVIYTLSKKYKNITLLCDINNMAVEIVKSDLAIGSVGLGAYERAALGVTGCLIPTAENQEEISCYFKELQLARVVFLNKSFMPNLIKELTFLMSSPQALSVMSNNGLELVDIFGAKHLVQEIDKCLAIKNKM